MMHEAIPQSVTTSPDLMTQYLQGRLPGVRELGDPSANVGQLVEKVEGGFISIESMIDAGLPDLAQQVSAEVQRRHTTNMEAQRQAVLSEAGEGFAWVLAGIDDVEAAVATLRTKKAPHSYRLVGDELYVSGVTSDQIAAALQATRP